MKLVIKGLTKKQAEILADWYDGQGEQDARIWFEETGEHVPLVDVARPGGCMKVKKKKVVLYCK